MPFPVRSFIGPRTETGLYACGPISVTGLCQFRYGHSNGPVLELDSVQVIPFPVPDSASSGTVIQMAPYRNWTLCVWSHFRYRALQVPFRTGTGLCALGTAVGGFVGSVPRFTFGGTRSNSNLKITNLFWQEHTPVMIDTVEVVLVTG